MVKKLKKKATKKQYTKFRVRVRSRHPSHSPLRKQLPLLPFRSVVRLGSTTVKNGDHILVECNSVEAVKNSANKLRMKGCFDKAGVKTAWFVAHPSQSEINQNENLLHTFNEVVGSDESYPLVAKHIFGSRGSGNYLLKSVEEFEKWSAGKTLTNYIFEKFHEYSREYRLHVTKEGCFYTCRKMLKSDTPEGKRWFRNDSNSVWIVEENPQFDKPVNWDKIVQECVKALNAVGLDIGACDVKVQSAKTKKGNLREDPEFFVIEINSAPRLGEGTLQRYLSEIPKVLKAKFVANN